MRRPSPAFRFLGASIMIWPMIDSELQRACSMLGADITERWEEMTAAFLPHPTSLPSFLHMAFVNRTYRERHAEELLIYVCSLDTYPPIIPEPSLPERFLIDDRISSLAWQEWLAAWVTLIYLPIDPDRTVEFRECDWHALISASGGLCIPGKNLVSEPTTASEILCAI